MLNQTDYYFSLFQPLLVVLLLPFQHLLHNFEGNTAENVKQQSEGARNMSEALRVNTSVTVAMFSGNYIKDEGCHYISDMLCVNPTLAAISLDENEIGKFGIIEPVQ